MWRKNDRHVTLQKEKITPNFPTNEILQNRMFLKKSSSFNLKKQYLEKFQGLQRPTKIRKEAITEKLAPRHSTHAN